MEQIKKIRPQKAANALTAEEARELSSKSYMTNIWPAIKSEALKGSYQCEIACDNIKEEHINLVINELTENHYFVYYNKIINYLTISW